MSQVTISGTTRIVNVVADPVFQLRTPQAQNEIWSRRGLNLVTVPAHVTADDLSGFLQSLRLNGSIAGAVVTVPHKQAAVGLCDELGPNAKATGAVNAIRRSADGQLIGETFDGLGFIAGLRAQHIEPEGRRVVVIGAGGAASAIAVALSLAGVQSIAIENRTSAKSEALAERIRAMGFSNVYTGTEHATDADLVINATSAGMTPGESVDFRVGRFQSTAIAAEVIVSNQHTPFLAAAADRGLHVHEGRHMLQGQMELIADYLTE